MRMAALLVVSALALAGPARAFSLEIPRLQAPQVELSMSLDLGVGLGSALLNSTPGFVVAPRYQWVVDDGRALWYSAGASAVVALGTHVLVGLPTTVITLMSLAALTSGSPAMIVPVLLGVGAAYFVGEAAVAAAAGWLVFNGASDVYEGNFLSAYGAHLGGAVAGVSVSALTFGIGGLLFGGLGALAEFTGSAGVTAIGVFSVLGSLPAVVIGGIALVGVPALFGAWALAATAGPKEGYAIDPAWRAPPPAAPVARGDAPALPLASLALPAP
ncbi:MAG: hypothetical protein IT382_15570 [Deltaproteobacteria bacterium]|nr:hypothetical protein [Deltaproteobacteria bacterium]